MESSNSSSDKLAVPDESDPNNREHAGFWHRWAKNAWEYKHAKRHRKETRSAWDEYEKEAADDTEKSQSYDRCNPAYWQACKTLEPAYYARTPKTMARRRDGVDDPAALLAGIYSKRLGDHLVEACEFDECFSKVVQEFIHSDKVTVQICYDCEKEKTRVDVVDGQATPEGVQVMEDAEAKGFYYEAEKVKNQKIYPKPVLYDEMIHTPTAKSWSEVTEVGYKFVLSRAEAEERFKDIGGITWKKGKSGTLEEPDEDSSDEGEFIDGWEIYDLKTGMQHWIAPGCCPGRFLDSRKDEWELRGLFPSPRPIIGSCPAKHMYPTPIFVQLSHTLKQMHVLHARIFKLIDGIRRRCLVDGTHPELLKAFDDLEESEYITVEDLSGLVDKVGGDVTKLIWYIPVQELVQAITELIELDRFFSEKFDLGFGVPDILKGVSDPLATAKAEQIATGAAHDRFRYQKSLVVKLAASTIEMMIDLALKVFEPEKLMRIWRVENLPPEHQPLHQQAVAILMNDEERLVRVDIQTDSMSFVNDQIENAARNAAVSTAVGGLKEVSGMLQAGSPQFAAIAAHTAVHALDGLRGGEDFIEEIKGQTKAAMEEASKPKGPPPPDPKQMEIQAKMQMHQEEMQLKMQQLQIQAEEIKLKREQMALEFQKLQAQFQQERIESAMEARFMQMQTALEERRLGVDEVRVGLEEREKLIEEQRLSKQADVDVTAAALEANRGPSHVTINLPKQSEPKASKKRTRIITPIRDELGEIVSARVEDGE